MLGFSSGGERSGDLVVDFNRFQSACRLTESPEVRYQVEPRKKRAKWLERQEALDYQMNSLINLEKEISTINLNASWLSEINSRK